MLCKNLSIRRKLEIGQHDGFAVRRIQNVEGAKRIPEEWPFKHLILPMSFRAFETGFQQPRMK